MKITIQEVEQAIDKATEQARSYTGSDREFTSEVVEPLKQVLALGVLAGLNCSEQRIVNKFKAFTVAVQVYLARPKHGIVCDIENCFEDDTKDEPRLGEL